MRSVGVSSELGASEESTFAGRGVIVGFRAIVSRFGIAAVEGTTARGGATAGHHASRPRAVRSSILGDGIVCNNRNERDRTQRS